VTFLVARGSKHYHQGRDFFWRRHPPRGETTDVGEDVFLAVSGSTPVAFATVWATPSSAQPQVRAYRAWRHVIDADAVRAELLRQRLREIDKRGLGGTIVDRAGIGLEEGVHRSHVHDGTAALADHIGRGSPRRPQRVKEVDVDRPCEVLIARAKNPFRRSRTPPTLFTSMSMRP
jgi:hypothetical protein